MVESNVSGPDPLIDEAIKMRKVNDHPNIVNVYDLVETQEA